MMLLFADTKEICTLGSYAVSPLRPDLLLAGGTLDITMIDDGFWTWIDVYVNL